MEVLIGFFVGATLVFYLDQKFRCRIFGHKPGMGYHSIEGEGYLRICRGGVDGIGREHASLLSECECCGKSFKVGNLHIDPEGKLLGKPADVMR